MTKKKNAKLMQAISIWKEYHWGAPKKKKEYIVVEMGWCPVLERYIYSGIEDLPFPPDFYVAYVGCERNWGKWFKVYLKKIKEDSK